MHTVDNHVRAPGIGIGKKCRVKSKMRPVSFIHNQWNPFSVNNLRYLFHIRHYTVISRRSNHNCEWKQGGQRMPEKVFRYLSDKQPVLCIYGWNGFMFQIYPLSPDTDILYPALLDMPRDMLLDKFKSKCLKNVSVISKEPAEAGSLQGKRKNKINLGIMKTVQQQPENFWAYNNGLTALVNDYDLENGKITFQLLRPLF